MKTVSTDELCFSKTGSQSDEVSPEELQDDTSPARGLLPFVITYLTSCIVFFGELGNFPLFNPDEGLYAEPAREMLEMGQYITTLLNYVVRYTKPPLTIWAQALSFQLFGVNEFAARFCSASAAVVLVAVTYVFAERYISRRIALIAALTLIAAPLFIGVGRSAITDMPLSLFIAGGLMAFYHAYHVHSRRWLWLAYVLTGLAVMTKGPVGLLLPAAIMIGFHIFRGELKQAIRFYRPIHGLAIVGLIAIPWFATEIWVTNGEYFREFILRENFQRFTSVVDHKAPWWYHIPALFGGLFPWSIFLPAAWLSAFGLGITPIRSVSTLPTRLIKHVRALQGKDELAFFLAWASLFILVFFSSSVSKLLSYTVPAFPLVAMLIGWQLDRWWQTKNTKPIAIGLGFLCTVYGIAYIVVPIALKHLRDCPPDLLSIIPTLLCVLFPSICLSFLLAIRGRTHIAVYSFTAVNLLATLLYGPQILSICANEWEIPLRNFAEYTARSGKPVIVLDMRKPSLPFYARRRVIVIPDKRQAAKDLAEIDDAYLIASAKDERLLHTLPQCHILTRQGRFILADWRNSRHSGQLSPN